MDDLTTDPNPIACTLSTSALRQREEVWAALAATALRSKVTVPSGVRLEFVADHQVTHQLLDLVVAERECCGWASWDLSHTAEVTVVEVSADGPGIRAVQLMFEAA